MNATGVKVNAKSLMKEKVPAISDSKSARKWSMDVKGTEIGAEMKDMATVVAELEAPNKSGEELDKALYVGRRSFRRGRREWGGHTCSGKMVKRNIKTCSGKVQYKTCGLCVNADKCCRVCSVVHVSNTSTAPLSDGPPDKNYTIVHVHARRTPAAPALHDRAQHHNPHGEHCPPTRGARSPPPRPPRRHTVGHLRIAVTHEQENEHHLITLTWSE